MMGTEFLSMIGLVLLLGFKILYELKNTQRKWDVLRDPKTDLNILT